ncbi:Negative regulator of mitotic exit [Tulasnella sp. 427]|nr:Negative regulator of mitotic exit [Tulasnella sp. 427]
MSQSSQRSSVRDPRRTTSDAVPSSSPASLPATDVVEDNQNTGSTLYHSTKGDEPDRKPTRESVSDHQAPPTVPPTLVNKREEASSALPYALVWAEHEAKPTATKLLDGSDSAEMTPDVLPRRRHTCSAVPNSDGEYIVFGGSTLPEKSDKELRTCDVALLSTTNMTLTALETTGAKPSPRMGHGAVVLGRVLIIFGGDDASSSLHFLNLDTRVWSNLRPPAPYPHPRYGFGFAIMDSTIWVFGGLRDTFRMDDLWCIDLGGGKHRDLTGALLKAFDGKKFPSKSPGHALDPITLPCVMMDVSTFLEVALLMTDQYYS